MDYESLDNVLCAVNNIVLAPVSDTHFEFWVKIAEKCFGIEKIDLKKKFEPRKFSSGEFCPKFIFSDNEKKLDGKSVYVLMTPSPFKSPEELFQRALITSQAAKENNAGKVVLLTPEFPHARQDRGPDYDEKAIGELNTVRHHARLMRYSGIDEVITVHEHSPLIDFNFAKEYNLIGDDMIFNDKNKSKVLAESKKVFKSISPHCFLADYLLHESSLLETDYLKDKGRKVVLKAVDKGNASFIDKLGSALFLDNISFVYCNKARAAKNDPNKVEIEIIKVSENFETLDGCVEIFADDMLDTGGTLIRSAKLSDEGNISGGKSYGVPSERIVYFTHAVLGGKSYESIQRRLFEELRTREFITTNTRDYICDGQYHDFKVKSTVLRLAFLLGDSILSNELGQDITVKYENFSSEDEQHEFISGLYNIKRHERHFMNRNKYQTRIIKDLPEILRR
jgi:phosphoribosylpyrophosphate synthetase